MEMNIHFKDEGKEIIHVFTGAGDSALAEPELTAHLRQILKIKLTNSCDYSWCELSDPYNKAWVKHLANLGYHLAVVWYDGSWPESSDLETELVEWWAEQSISDDPWVFAGQLIYRSSAKRPDYPHIYPGCAIINLQEYLIAGEPSPLFFDTAVRMPNFKLSGDNIHDDYTPTWIERSEGELPKESHSYPGTYLDHLITNSLVKDYRVINLPTAIRHNMHSCYPEDDIEETKTWLLDPDFLKGKTPREIKEFGYTLPEDKMELYGYKIQQFQVLYVTNTESVPKRDPELNDVGFTRHVVPCAGLHQFWHLLQDQDTLSSVLWYDFNPYAIQWTEMILMEWDGRDFVKFYEDNISRVISDGVIAEDCVIFDPELYHSLTASVGEDSTGQLLGWTYIQSLDHDFLECDIVNNWREFCEAVGYNNRLFVQLTNIWQYESNYLNTCAFEAQTNFLNIIKTLLAENLEVYFTGNSPGGQHFTYANMRLQRSIL